MRKFSETFNQTGSVHTQKNTNLDKHEEERNIYETVRTEARSIYTYMRACIYMS